VVADHLDDVPEFVALLHRHGPGADAFQGRLDPRFAGLGLRAPQVEEPRVGLLEGLGEPPEDVMGLGSGLQCNEQEIAVLEVGDVVDIGGLVGTVRRIGLRASHIQTRSNITVIVPNSKLVVDNVVNWSHSDDRARFQVSVGVAYGSDTELVKNLLIECAQANEKILNFPRPFVRFVDFGNSSLDFELHFWANEFIRIEDVKSDVRFSIDRAFREHEVTIPFPQRDVWFKNPIHQENGQAPREATRSQEDQEK